MDLSINQKQNFIFICLILLSIAASIFAYRATQQKWIVLKEAEEKFSNHAFYEAIVLYKKSLEEGKTTPKVLLRLADSYVAVGNFSEGINFYRSYLEYYPDDSKVRLSLARTLGWNGNIKESEQEYQKILEHSNEVDSKP